MEDGFKGRYSDRELKEAFYKDQLLADWQNFEKDFGEYFNLKTISVETKYNKCLGLVRVLIDKVDATLNSIYDRQFVGCDEIIPDEQIQNIKDNCFLLLQITINQECFQKYLNSIENFKDKEIQLLLEYLSKLDIIKKLQWLYPKEFEELTIEYIEKSAILATRFNIMDTHYGEAVVSNSKVRASLDKMRLNDLFYRRSEG